MRLIYNHLVAPRMSSLQLAYCLRISRLQISVTSSVSGLTTIVRSDWLGSEASISRLIVATFLRLGLLIYDVDCEAGL